MIVLVTVRSDRHREPQGTLSALFCLVQDGGFYVNYQPQREQQFAVLRGLGPVGRKHPNANFQICLKTSDKNRCHQSLLSDISCTFFAALKVVMIRCLFSKHRSLAHLAASTSTGWRISKCPVWWSPVWEPGDGSVGFGKISRSLMRYYWWFRNPAITSWGW